MGPKFSLGPRSTDLGWLAGRDRLGQGLGLDLYWFRLVSYTMGRTYIIHERMAATGWDRALGWISTGFAWSHIQWVELI